MQNKVDEIRKLYTENLKAKYYYEEIHKQLLSIEDYFVFNLKFIYDVLQSGRFKGSKMLEIGSGPTVHYVASASAYFSTIVQSDFVEDNQKELKRWLKEEPGHLDWSQFLDLVAKVEGMGLDPISNRQILSSRIRASVKAVIRTDVLSDSIIILKEELNQDCSPPYDLITSFWCIEDAALDFDSYVAILKRINNLLRPGGGLILAAFVNGGTWCVGDKPFHCLKISLNDATNALTMAGFVNHDFRVQPKSIEFDYDYDGIFCVATQKQ